MEHPPLVCIHEPFDAREIALIELALSESGIRYHLENEPYARGSFAIGDARVRLLVEGTRAEDARKMLREVPGIGPLRGGGE